MKKCLLILSLLCFQPAFADYTTDCLKGKKYSTACQNMLKRYWQYSDLIEKIGRQEGVDPSLLKALIAYESSYNAKARSGADAKGLTQVIPGTARQHGVNNSQYLYIPEVSIRTGAKELAKLWRMFGRLDLTLAGYNAGPNAVKKYGYKVPPYAETKAYVKNIGRLYQEFKAVERVKAPLAVNHSGSLNVTPQNIHAQVKNAKFQPTTPQMTQAIQPQAVQVAYESKAIKSNRKKASNKRQTIAVSSKKNNNNGFITVIAN